MHSSARVRYSTLSAADLCRTVDRAEFTARCDSENVRAVIAEATYVDMPPAEIVIPEVPYAAMRGARRFDAPAILAFSLANVFLYGPYAFVSLPTGHFIREASDFESDHEFDQNTRFMRDLMPGQTVPWPRCRRPAFLLTGFAPQNHWHWFVDNLPHLRYAADALPDRFGVIGAWQYNKASGDSLHAIEGIGGRCIPFDGTIALCDRLVFATRSAGADAEKVAFLRRAFDRGPVLDRRAPRIYIDRSGANRRRIVNDGEIASLFRSRGFAIVRPETMSFWEQRALFAQAEVIAGPHGAGFANAVFAPTGGVLFELTHPGMVEALDIQRHAAACGHRFGCAVGETVGEGPGANADFSIEPEAVAAGLDAMGVF